jgi:hypothetical protein
MTKQTMWRKTKKFSMTGSLFEHQMLSEVMMSAMSIASRLVCHSSGENPGFPVDTAAISSWAVKMQSADTKDCQQRVLSHPDA